MNQENEYDMVMDIVWHYIYISKKKKKKKKRERERERYHLVVEVLGLS